MLQNRQGDAIVLYERSVSILEISLNKSLGDGLGYHSADLMQRLADASDALAQIYGKQKVYQRGYISDQTDRFRDTAVNG